jgi:hypothetical protein
VELKLFPEFRVISPNPPFGFEVVDVQLEFPPAFDQKGFPLLFNLIYDHLEWLCNRALCALAPASPPIRAVARGEVLPLDQEWPFQDLIHDLAIFRTLSIDKLLLAEYGRPVSADSHLPSTAFFRSSSFFEVFGTMY